MLLLFLWRIENVTEICMEMGSGNLPPVAVLWWQVAVLGQSADALVWGAFCCTPLRLWLLPSWHIWHLNRSECPEWKHARLFLNHPDERKPQRLQCSQQQTRSQECVVCFYGLTLLLKLWDAVGIRHLYFKLRFDMFMRPHLFYVVKNIVLIGFILYSVEIIINIVTLEESSADWLTCCVVWLDWSNFVSHL